MLPNLANLRSVSVLLVVAVLSLLTQIGGAIVHEGDDVRSPNQSNANRLESAEGGALRIARRLADMGVSVAAEG